VTIDQSLNREPYCYLTTRGRITGRPHEIEIWFALHGDTIYLLNGNSERDAGRADWIRNIRWQPAVTLRIAGQTFGATGRFVTDLEEDALVRRLLFEKYQPTYSGDLSIWARTGFPVALDLVTSSNVHAP
jgi:deazaflavin-dependent oxidoreductase (nitroreductase family)